MKCLYVFVNIESNKILLYFKYNVKLCFFFFISITGYINLYKEDHICVFIVFFQHKKQNVKNVNKYVNVLDSSAHFVSFITNW